MKKGFTLIELLIVMIIVGILAAIAVPKYNAAVERSRSMEGILNLEKLSDEVNAMYIVNKNIYPAQEELNKFNTTDQVIKSTYFNAPVLTRNGDTSVTISIERKSGSGYCYKLQIVNSYGEPQAISCIDESCTASEKGCSVVSINLTK
jgi:prepilin-type N-terminal cleavage/methylation domain-containing protein